eukprot:403859-Amphidinium_carterae.1
MPPNKEATTLQTFNPACFCRASEAQTSTHIQYLRPSAGTPDIPQAWVLRTPCGVYEKAAVYAKAKERKKRPKVDSTLS